jgi:hypothetical protein
MHPVRSIPSSFSEVESFPSGEPFDWARPLLRPRSRCYDSAYPRCRDRPRAYIISVHELGISWQRRSLERQFRYTQIKIGQASNCARIGRPVYWIPPQTEPAQRPSVIRTMTSVHGPTPRTALVARTRELTRRCRKSS